MKAIRLRVAGLAAAVVAGLVPGSALACAMCFNANQEAREAYYITTALMIAVPFALAGGFGFWLRRMASGPAAAGASGKPGTGDPE